MSKPGLVGWFDLAVDDADGIRDFYEKVVGWKSTGTDMGEYQDYCMSPAGSDEPIGGICHKKGPNAGMPSQWLMYINVENLDQSIKSCCDLGGKIVCEPRDLGSFGSVAVIEDPAGAVVAIIQPR